jgi:site-specific DNA-methyltransferase (adenine-specific)
VSDVKAYYSNKFVTVYNADSASIDFNVYSSDILFTDPPYGIGKRTGTISRSRSHKNAYIQYDDSPENVAQIIVPIVKAALLACNGRGIITPGTACMCLYPSPTAFGVLYQPAACGMNKWGWADCQPIFYYGKDPRAGKTITRCSFIVTERASSTEHPCAKPIEVWQKLLEKGTLDGDTVLDPFAGSGTTGIACMNLGRRCILIEKEEKYCEVIARRLEYHKPLNRLIKD